MTKGGLFLAMPDSGAELQRQADLIRRQIFRKKTAGHIGVLHAGAGKSSPSEVQA